jgi:hypothetical protein
VYSSAHSLTSALDGGEWSASRPGRFTPRERAPGDTGVINTRDVPSAGYSTVLVQVELCGVANIIESGSMSH